MIKTYPQNPISLSAMLGSRTFLYLNCNDTEPNFYIAERYIANEFLCNHESLLGWLYRRDLHEETRNGQDIAVCSL